MPRRARRDDRSNYLHVIVQGIDREYIFDKKKYIEKYYELMIKKMKKYDIRVLAYCIMNNHAHILVYSEKIQLISDYMKSLNTEYAHFYNNSKDRVGYVFRDRFMSEPIMNEKQLYNCIAYIHFNPVVANIVDEPHQYKYSSYNDYLKKNGVINDEIVKMIFGGTNNYLEMFQFIHYSKGEAMDIKSRQFLGEYNEVINVHNIEELKSECLRLKKLNVSNRKIAELLKVNRNKVDRILK